MGKPAILVDINGTLSNTANVVHFLRGPKKDWESFFNRMNDVPANKMVVEMMKRFRNGHTIILISGAPEIYLNRTKQWLSVHGITAYDEIIFRPEWDKRPGFQYKKTVYEKRVKPRYNVRLVLDDKQDACDMWRSLGLECWQAAPDPDSSLARRSTKAGERFAHLVRPSRARAGR